MEGQLRKLFALGLLGVAVVLVWMPRVSSFEVGEDALGHDVGSEEGDLAETDFVYRSRTLKATNDKSSGTKRCPLRDDSDSEGKGCSERCSNRDHDCKDFVGKPWPPSIYGGSSDSCRICQGNAGNKKVFFATLYNTKYRIPEYTATKIIKAKKGKKDSDNKYWKRIQLGLCSKEFHSHLRNKCKYGSDTHKWGVKDVSSCPGVDGTMRMEQCGDCQALDEDLAGCGEIAERGHINPREINDNRQDAQKATYSMINMAPQAPKFNKIWSQLEAEVTKKAEKINKNKNNKSLYVITGTKISNNDKWVKGRVLFPRFFWKAVCYPGDKSAKQKPFGVGVYGENKSTTTKENMKVLSLPEFDEWLYGKGKGKHIFQGSVCDKRDIDMWNPLAEKDEL